ncbi:MAG: signal peptidase II [Patescibacteria group bacterium]
MTDRGYALAMTTGLAVLFCIDRTLKWWATHALVTGKFLIGRSVGMVLAYNEGIAYGMRLPRLLLMIIVGGIIVSCVFFIIRAFYRRARQQMMALGLIVAGAFSNLLDRLQHGYVIDYATVTGWPIFNIADVMIAAGAVWLIVLAVGRRPKRAL